MYHGNTIQLPAKDISPEALETGKIVYKHNNQLANLLAASGQQSDGNAFIYARSSRTNDISIDTQRKACLQYAAINKLELLSFGYQSDNNISARNMNNLKHELGFWQEHIPDGSNIIIYSIDRLSRNLIKGMQYLDEMAARGIRIHFVTHELVFHSGISAAGRSMIQQELQSAEKFSNIASEKVRTTMARLRREGNVFGRAPYGYKHTKIGNIRKRTFDNKEQQNIRKIKEQYKYIMDNWKNMPETAELRYSKINMLRTLSRWCNRTGLQYRNEKNYTTYQIQKIIALEINAN
jgi:DNA invertase Pin-like site-specific DNA recombinase